MKNKDQYEDIINLPHPTSSKHPQMSLYNRAAQFSPFAALTGHSASIQEVARLTEERIFLEEDELIRLNERIKKIIENIETHPEIQVIYFVPDERKSGGSYQKFYGKVKRIDEVQRQIVFKDNTVIAIDSIIEIKNDGE